LGIVFDVSQRIACVKLLVATAAATLATVAGRSPSRRAARTRRIRIERGPSRKNSPPPQNAPRDATAAREPVGHPERSASGTAEVSETGAVRYGRVAIYESADLRRYAAALSIFCVSESGTGGQIFA